MGKQQVVYLVVVFLVVGVVLFNKVKAPSQTSQQNSDLVFNQNQQSAAQPTQAVAPTKTMKQYQQFPGALAESELKNKKAVIETDKGNIEFEIYPEATKAASNFIFLAKDGFFDGLIFHRVVPNFVIQGGDPLGTGAGGPGYTFKEDHLVYTKYDKGIVAMAKTSAEPAGTGGSQFFIMIADNPLPPDYVIFGKVLAGQDVVPKIQVGDKMNKVTISPLK